MDTHSPKGFLCYSRTKEEKSTDYDLAVSCLPTTYGEKLVMHIYCRNAIKALPELGILRNTQQHLEDLLSEPTGLLLVAGPHHSGKTTTLYSLLQRMNISTHNIVTIERTSAYRFPNVTQVYLNSKTGPTLPAVLEMLENQDTDALMLDELPDAEAATLALEASRKQWTLTEVTANSAVNAIQHWLDSGVRPRLMATNLRGVLAQRLVRKVCHNCKAYDNVAAQELERFGFLQESPDQQVQVAKGKGCERCKNTGYRGQIGLFELLTVTDTMALLIERQASAAEIAEQARRDGMSLLREDGLSKILEGVTTPEEVARVLGARALKPI